MTPDQKITPSNRLTAAMYIVEQCADDSDELCAGLSMVGDDEFVREVLAEMHADSDQPRFDIAAARAQIERYKRID